MLRLLKDPAAAHIFPCSHSHTFTHTQQAEPGYELTEMIIYTCTPSNLRRPSAGVTCYAFWYTLSPWSCGTSLPCSSRSLRGSNWSWYATSFRALFIFWSSVSPPRGSQNLFGAPVEKEMGKSDMPQQASKQASKQAGKQTHAQASTSKQASKQ